MFMAGKQETWMHTAKHYTERRFPEKLQNGTSRSLIILLKKNFPKVNSEDHADYKLQSSLQQ